MSEPYGLLLDVLATGDGPGVDAAFERYLAGVTAARVARSVTQT